MSYPAWVASHSAASTGYGHGGIGLGRADGRGLMRFTRGSVGVHMDRSHVGWLSYVRQAQMKLDSFVRTFLIATPSEFHHKLCLDNCSV